MLAHGRRITYPTFTGIYSLIRWLVQLFLTHESKQLHSRTSSLRILAACMHAEVGQGAQGQWARARLQHGLQDHRVVLHDLAQRDELRVGAQEVQRAARAARARAPLCRLAPRTAMKP